MEETTQPISFELHDYTKKDSDGTTFEDAKNVVATAAVIVVVAWAAKKIWEGSIRRQVRKELRQKKA